MDAAFDGVSDAGGEEGGAATDVIWATCCLVIRQARNLDHAPAERRSMPCSARTKIDKRLGSGRGDCAFRPNFPNI